MKSTVPSVRGHRRHAHIFSNFSTPQLKQEVEEAAAAAARRRKKMFPQQFGNFQRACFDGGAGRAVVFHRGILLTWYNCSPLGREGGQHRE